MTISEHDTLEEWQTGRITTRSAIDITGVEDVEGLYSLAQRLSVDIRMHFLPKEEDAL